MKEERLITKARKGNARAFEKLMLAHQETLYKTAYLYLRNKEDALMLYRKQLIKLLSV